MSAAIYYHPEAYTTHAQKLMGRNAAGESFLRGFATYSEAKAFWVQVQNPEHAQHFANTIRACGRTEPVKAVNKSNLGALSQAGVVYFPGPGLGIHAWHRSAVGHGTWSLCGITHTTSSARAMDAIAEFITAPLQPWDALICTSTAVKDNVQRVLHAQAEYLKTRLGTTKLVLPQLPVIPLGIHTDDFAFTEEQKLDARRAIRADENTIVVLFMGRLSFHAKAHPLVMYQALEQAAGKAGKPVVLVECGWHANEHIQKAYAQAASSACPSVRVVTLDGRNASERQVAWASADVFCSLSDNIQETFGIAPIEAMAAGLPVVVSDWDGYRDTVRHGIDGFRVPTVSPSPRMGQDLAARHALEIDSYDMYCGYASTFVAVDLPAAVDAFFDLFTSPQLRQEMGQAALARARSVFDWKVVIAQYEMLWAELNALRTEQSNKLDAPSVAWPARMDPFAAFASYPTTVLGTQTRLALVDASAEQAEDRLLQYQRLAMVNFANAVLPTPNELISMLRILSSGPQEAAQMVLHLEAARRAQALRGLAWLLKLGLLKVCT